MKSCKTSLFLFFICLLVSVSFISAQDFSHTQQCSEYTGAGLSLSVAHPVIAQIGQPVTISIIAYDSQGKKKTASDTECTIGLADSQGTGISLINETQITIIPSPIDAWQGVFAAGNFTRTTNFGFIARCETVNTGGCFEAHFLVTPDGQEEKLFPDIFQISILAYFILFIGLRFESRILKIFSSFMLIVTGMLILYPGYGSVADGTLLSLVFGSINCGLGFYYSLEDSFSKKKQADSYNQDHDDKEEDEDYEEEETYFESERRKT